MAKTSSNKKHFHWSNKVSNEDHEEQEKTPPFILCPQKDKESELPSPLTRKTPKTLTIPRIRSVLTALSKNRTNSWSHGLLGPRVVGTLFGSRKGHVHIAFQKHPSCQPAFLIELQTPISGLVKEMASGLVRITLECDKQEEKIKKNGDQRRLLEEPVWRTYCNGKKCGFAIKRECGEKVWKVLKAVEPISMGAGVMPADKPSDEDEDDEDDQWVGFEGEIMYMRAKFERVVGSRDSEAFYMMNPDSNGAPELSVYLLRI